MVCCPQVETLWKDNKIREQTLRVNAIPSIGTLSGGKQQEKFPQEGYLYFECVHSVDLSHHNATFQYDIQYSYCMCHSLCHKTKSNTFNHIFIMKYLTMNDFLNIMFLMVQEKKIAIAVKNSLLAKINNQITFFFHLLQQ